MATNVAIDPDEPDRFADVNERASRRAQAEIVKHCGVFDDWDPDFDYKESRRARDRRLGLID